MAPARQRTPLLRCVRRTLAASPATDRVAMGMCHARRHPSLLPQLCLPALWLLAIGSPHAQAHEPQDFKAVQAADISLRGAIVVPLARSKSGLLIARARINGVEGRFVIDTGASATVVETGAHRRLNMRLDDGDARTGSGAGGRIRVHPSSGNTLQIGSHRVQAFDTVVMPLGQVNAAFTAAGDEPIDGVIGADVLRPVQAVIDYGRHVLYLRPPASTGPHSTRQPASR